MEHLIYDKDIYRENKFFYIVTLEPQFLDLNQSLATFVRLAFFMNLFIWIFKLLKPLNS